MPVMSTTPLLLLTKSLSKVLISMPDANNVQNERLIPPIPCEK